MFGCVHSSFHLAVVGLVIVIGIDRLTGPVRILSVVVMITYRHAGNEHQGDGPKLPYQTVVIQQSARHR